MMLDVRSVEFITSAPTLYTQYGGWRGGVQGSTRGQQSHSFRDSLVVLPLMLCNRLTLIFIEVKVAH